MALPRIGIVDPPPLGDRLPFREGRISRPDQNPAWFFVGAHGGAGTTLLSALSQAFVQGRETAIQPTRSGPEFGLDAGCSLPDPALEPTGTVVLVARSTMSGLNRAKTVGQQYLSGTVPTGVRLLGLITVADQPGRLPKPIAAAERLISGSFARHWRIPYVAAFRMCLPGDYSSCDIPYAVAAVLADINRCNATEAGP